MKNSLNKIDRIRVIISIVIHGVGACLSKIDLRTESHAYFPQTVEISFSSLFIRVFYSNNL